MNYFYASIDAIKHANRIRGHHWFEPGALRFFRSRIGQTVYAGCLFVSSEQFVDSQHNAHPRRYTLRIALPDGSIDTVGEFQAFRSADAARNMARKIAAWLENAS